MLKGQGLLTPLQRTFLQAFAGLPDQQRFFLTGGTALTEFYLAHRVSFDLDFFTSEEALIVPFSYRVAMLADTHPFQVEVVRRFATYVEFLITQDTDTLKVDLAFDSPFRFAALVISEYGVWVNPFEDLRVDKLLAYYGRAEPRDAADLYFILQREPLAPLLDLAVQKDPGFDLYWFAVALNRAADFPDDLARWPVKMLKPIVPADLKSLFKTIALDIMVRIAQP